MEECKDDDLKLYTCNPNHHLVDSLPFVDSVPLELESTVKQLIEDEQTLILKEFGGTEDELLNRYLEPLPFDASKFVKPDALYNRLVEGLKNGEEEKEKLRLDKYEKIALDEHKSPEEAIDHAKMLLEYSRDSNINLELMDRYKEAVWLKYLDDLTLLKMRMSDYKRRLQDELDAVNKRRKMQHIACANTIRNTNNEYNSYQNKNRMLVEALMAKSMLVTSETLQD